MWWILKSSTCPVVYQTPDFKIGSDMWRAVVYHDNEGPLSEKVNRLTFEWKEIGTEKWRVTETWRYFNPKKPNKGLPFALVHLKKKYKDEIHAALTSQGPTVSIPKPKHQGDLFNQSLQASPK